MFFLIIKKLIPNRQLDNYDLLLNLVNNEIKAPSRNQGV